MTTYGDTFDARIETTSPSLQGPERTFIHYSERHDTVLPTDRRVGVYVYEHELEDGELTADELRGWVAERRQEYILAHVYVFPDCAEQYEPLTDKQADIVSCATWLGLDVCDVLDVHPGFGTDSPTVADDE